MVIRWENVDDLEDYFITYLLYADSFTVPQISRIRNMTEESVNKDLILAKTRLREVRKSSDTPKSDIIEKYLSLSKEERLDFIKKVPKNELESFKMKVYKSILKTDNAEDLMVLVWTVGELKDDRFLNIIYPLLDKGHSNLRRIAYSALGKIGNSDSCRYIEMGLSDSNPQIRQYCAKYLGKIGTRNSLRILENVIKNKSDFEKRYVLRACDESIIKLKQKFTISK
ncbi:HEAT repeat domain-containing protein [Peptostreptococcus sp. D1]|uniref:HEAT repeat domain-containing protein n=1 Tax=Peptostreptococcus sp. D1 TaxID=72304 RepID=UPI0008F3D9C2|nr:HEAT repeat domain-containing protein [Peptostreptococcus sp. D1]SFE70880.1 HEAT repeat-containing protein [Peptostreptococcus sp. D1]